MRLVHFKYLFIVSMAFALPALAQGFGPTKTMKFDKFVAEVDTKHDGKITLTEWKAAGLQEVAFNYVDKQKRGYVTKQALESTQFASAMDTDGDGELTLAEMKAFDAKTSSKSTGGASDASGGGGASATPSAADPK